MVSELVERWLKWHLYNKGHSEATVVKYRRYLGLLIEFAGDRDVLKLTSDELRTFTGEYAHKLKLSPRSRRALVAAVRGFYKWLCDEGVIKSNQAAIIEYPKAGRSLPTPLGLHNAERLLMAPDLNTFKGVRDAAILAALMGSGQRVSGLCNMNQSSLVFTHDSKGRERLQFKVREKGDKQRYIPVPDETRYLIRAYLGHREIDTIDRTLPSGDSVLFVSLRNRSIPPHEYHGEARRMSSNAVYNMIVKYGTALGIPADQLGPHAIRHLYGTELAESDVSTLISQALMGHADPKTTEIYTQVAMRKMIEVIDKANPLRKIRTPVTDLLKHLE